MTALWLGHEQTAHAACSTSDPYCASGPIAGLSGGYAENPEGYVVGIDWGTELFGGFGVKLGAGLRLVQQLNDKGTRDPFAWVDMSQGSRQPMVEAQWAEGSPIKLRFLPSASADAEFSARYTLAVNAEVAATRNGDEIFKKNWDLTKEFNRLNDDFAFDAQGSTRFTPWALSAPAEMAVVGGSIATTTLFKLSFDRMGLAKTTIDGEIGAYLTTEDTIFQYRTLGASFDGARGDALSDFELPQQTEYGDELQVQVRVRGGVRVEGAMYMKPYVMLNSVAGWGVGDGATKGSGGYNGWPIRYSNNSVAVKREFSLPNAAEGMMEFDFPEATLIVPIPNVKLAKDKVELSGKSGRLNITNSGTKEARVSFASAGGGFQVPGNEQVIPPGGNYELPIVYSGTDSATGEITITTNDPDSPLYKVLVGANGAAVGDPDGSGRTSDGMGGTGVANEQSDGDGGCGCRTSGAQGSLSALGSIALGTLGTVLAMRRRRR